jgi:hypothetical protein
MDTNEKSENSFSIRDSFFVFFKSRRDDLRYLRTHPSPIALSARATEIGEFTRGFAVNLNKYKLKLKEKYGTI